MSQLSPRAVRLHNKLLNDRGRTGRFIAAIEEVVRPGDVVVDIGTGTGILALAAARAGAKRVYAIESGPVCRVAERMFAVNGVADRVTLVAGRSTRVELPERADVLVTETFGNGPLSEDVLEITIDARRRLLKPDARVLPRTVRICALPVSVPAAELRENVFTPAAVEQWRSWYGVDFGPLREVNRHRLLMHCMQPKRLRRWKALGAPVLLTEIDLGSHVRQSVRATGWTVASPGGALTGIVLYFELRLSPSVTLSTCPREAPDDNHWLNPVYYFVDPLRLRAGDVLRLDYQYRNGEEMLSVSAMDP